MAASIALSGGPTVPTMAWLAIPLLTLGSRFSERGIVAGTIISVAFLLIVAFGVNAQAVLHSPPLVIAPVTLMLCVSLFQTVLMRSELKYREAAVIDPLTGLLNRGALSQRASELEQQSTVNHQPVGLVIVDLDHFKRINDKFGHGAGDIVLQDVAYQMRRTLRAFDLIYRAGGEEFLILLPGADLDRATRLAEDIHMAIGTGLRGGHRVTASLGVAASPAGQPFSYNAVFTAADAALYEAKHNGRDRVCSSSQTLTSVA
jgi:diguanylate cyclase (GGDEF)-like protein